MTQSTPEIRFIRMRHLTNLVGLSRTEIYRRIQRGTFPESIPLGARAVAWPSDRIEQWIADQIRKASDPIKTRGFGPSDDNDEPP